MTLKGGRVGGLPLKTVPSGPTRFCHSSGHVCGTLPDPGPPLTEGPGQGFRANEVRSQSDALWLWPCVWSRALARLQRASHHPGQGGAPALRGAELGSIQGSAGGSLGDAPPTAGMTVWGCGLSY